MAVALIRHPKDFFASKWQRQPSLWRCEASTPYHSFGLQQLNAVLNFTGLRYPNFRVYQNGILVAPDAYSGPTRFARQIVPNVVDVGRALQCFKNRGSFVIQNIELFDSTLRDACKSIEKEFGNAVHMTAFLTNGEGAGLAVHDDPIDVFLTQSVGTRLWNVEVEPQTGRFTQFRVHAGDTLYIPAFHQHFPEVSTGPSLHLSICIDSTSPSILVAELLEKSELMRPIKSQLNYANFYLSSTRRKADSTRRIAAACANLPSKEEIRPEVDLLVDVLASSSSVRSDSFRRADPRERAVDIESSTYEKACSLFHFDNVRSRSALYFNGRKMSVPDASRMVVAHICRADRFKLRDLPGLLTQEKKKELLAELDRIGFIAPLDKVSADPRAEVLAP